MSDYIDAATLLAGIGIGALLISLLWGIVVGFSPRRRQEPAPPELQPERPPPLPAPQRRREPLPPLADTADDLAAWPPPWWDTDGPAARDRRQP